MEHKKLKRVILFLINTKSTKDNESLIDLLSQIKDSDIPDDLEKEVLLFGENITLCDFENINQIQLHDTTSNSLEMIKVVRDYLIDSVDTIHKIYLITNEKDYDLKDIGKYIQKEHPFIDHVPVHITSINFSKETSNRLFLEMMILNNFDRSYCLKFNTKQTKVNFKKKFQEDILHFKNTQFNNATSKRKNIKKYFWSKARNNLLVRKNDIFLLVLRPGHELMFVVDKQADGIKEFKEISFYHLSIFHPYISSIKLMFYYLRLVYMIRECETIGTYFLFFLHNFPPCPVRDFLINFNQTYKCPFDEINTFFSRNKKESRMSVESWYNPSEELKKLELLMEKDFVSIKDKITKSIFSLKTYSFNNSSKFISIGNKGRNRISFAFSKTKLNNQFTYNNIIIGNNLIIVENDGSKTYLSYTITKNKNDKKLYKKFIETIIDKKTVYNVDLQYGSGIHFIPDALNTKKKIINYLPFFNNFLDLFKYLKEESPYINFHIKISQYNEFNYRQIDEQQEKIKIIFVIPAILREINNIIRNNTSNTNYIISN